MAKITTIIDIGSNSMRMVVFKKSSRFAFNLLNETKSRVKISEGSYENNGYLQEVPMQRAFNSLKSFLSISNSLKSRKILCVATSALRDAPNSNEFLARVRNELGINIKVIDGTKEAYYGGVAASNLLHTRDFVTIDIGGGSTEFCFVKNGVIQESISLNLGTVRLRELYFNKRDFRGALKYVSTELKKLEHRKDEFNTVVGIGGTIRALSKAIISKSNYPFDTLHGFTYKLKEYIKYFDEIIKVKDVDNLKDLYIKKERFDTIQEGTFIFKTVIEKFNCEELVTSGAGVREGVYLSDLLRNSNHKFPENFNPSVRSLLDRFEIDPKQSAYLGNNAKKIFEVLKPIHNLDDKFKRILVIASKLQSIGVTLNFYRHSENTFNFILNGLNYDISHEDRVLVAHIVRYSKKSLPKEKHLDTYEMLLPDYEVVSWLSFMISLNITLNTDMSRPKLEYILDENKLTINSETDIYLSKLDINKLEIPVNLDIIIR